MIRRVNAVVPVSTGGSMEPWLVQAIVSGARSDARNGSRDHTGEKRHKDQQWRIDSVRQFFISCRPTPHLLLGQNCARNGLQFRAMRGFIQAHFRTPFRVLLRKSLSS